MAMTKDGKVYRNLQEQVLENAKDIEDIKEHSLTAGKNISISNDTIKVIDSPTFENITVDNGTSGLYVNDLGDVSLVYQSGNLTAENRIYQGCPELINRSENYQASLIVGTDGIEIEKKDLVNDVTVRKDLFETNTLVLSLTTIPYTCTEEELNFIKNHPERVYIIHVPNKNVFRYSSGLPTGGSGTINFICSRPRNPSTNYITFLQLSINMSTGYISFPTNDYFAQVSAGTDASGNYWESLTVGGTTHPFKATQLYKHSISINGGTMELISTNNTIITTPFELFMQFVQYRSVLRAYYEKLPTTTIPYVLYMNMGTNTFGGFNLSGTMDAVTITDTTLVDTVTAI